MHGNALELELIMAGQPSRNLIVNGVRYVSLTSVKNRQSIAGRCPSLYGTQELFDNPEARNDCRVM